MSCVANTNSVDLAVIGGVLTADVILDPNVANAASISASGLMVAGANETGWFAAGETWTALGADPPNFTLTIPGDKTAKYQVGHRFKVTQTNDRVFVVVGVSYNGGTGLTTVTLYGGTANVLAGAAIVNPSYSPAKAPLGFNPDPTLWTEEKVDAGDRTQTTPVQNQWYNVGGILLAIPVGSWYLQHEEALSGLGAGGGGSVFATLSTANNSETDTKMTVAHRADVNLNNLVITHFRERPVTVATKTPYYLNAKAGNPGSGTIGFFGSTYSPSIIRAICALL